MSSLSPLRLEPLQTSKDWGPYCQLLRMRTICTRDLDFECNAKLILDHYMSRGYHDAILQEALTRERSLNRAHLLRELNPTNTPTESTLFCVLPYNPSNPPVKAIINQHWPILYTDPKLNCISSKKINISYRRSKALKEFFVHSRLNYRPSPSHPTAVPTNDINPTKICHNVRCRYCSKPDLSGKV